MLREVLTQAHSLGHDRESVGRNFRIKSSLKLISPPLGSTFHFSGLTQVDPRNTRNSQLGKDV